MVKVIFVQLATLGLFCLTVWYWDGARGFRPLLQPDLLLLVFGGTFLLSLPHLRRPFLATLPSTLHKARDYAIAMGALTSLLGMIAMLATIDDVAQIPRRLSMVLGGLFYGYLLSEVLLAPLESLPEDPSSRNLPGRRSLIGGAAGSSVLLAFFVVLYALARPLADPVAGDSQVIYLDNRTNQPSEKP